VTSDGVVSLLRFDAPPRRDWEDLVRRSLRGDSLDTLVGRTAEGLDIEPLYTAEGHPTSGDPGGLPGGAPFTRGGHRVPERWELRQRHDLTDPAETAGTIRSDVAGGANAIWLRLSRPPGPGELLTALAGVNPTEVRVFVDGGPWFAAAAEATAALATAALATAAPTGRLVAGADPLGALARHGFLLSEVDDALAQLVPLVQAIRRRRHRNGDSAGPAGARPVTLDATVYADAGAPPALELACMLATGVAYLRALEAGGIEPQPAARHIEARLVATADQFATICKLRAARMLWDRALAACDVATSGRRALRCWAVTSEAMFVTQDPFVNLVRATTAAFAAAAGGADCITVLPYDVALGDVALGDVALGDVALGPPGERGRRLARNISHLLADEADLGAVTDPAGGSWYAEDRTARLAEAAWEQFRRIEAAGGMAEALGDGSLAARIDQAAERRREGLAGGAEHVVGVTCYLPPASGEGSGSDPAGSSAPVARRAQTPPDAAVCIPPLPLRRPGSEQS